MKSLCQIDETIRNHSRFCMRLSRDQKAAVQSHSLRKRTCNLSSYLCIWRSAQQCCHDLFYSDEARCQNLCLAAKPHVKWPAGGLCVTLWIAISSLHNTKREEKKKQGLGQKTHSSHTLKHEESERLLRHQLRFRIPANFWSIFFSTLMAFIRCAGMKFLLLIKVMISQTSLGFN